ncbi:MAG TPA: PAS domain S-box protein [Gaiellaceae bacterium]|nr:PAS domain S-box protein [Gaiellaceae bacterium]
METDGSTVACGDSRLALEEERRLLVEQLPGYVWTTDADLVVTSLVGTLATLRGAPLEILGSRVEDLDALTGGTHAMLGAHRRALRGESVSYEVERDGRVFAARVEPLRAADGSVAGVVGVAHELTEQRRRSERWKRLVQSVDAILWEADLQRLEVTFVSEAVERLLGFPPSQWLGDPGFWRSRIHPDDLPKAPNCARLPEGDSFELEYRIIAADRRIRTFRDFVRVSRDEQGTPLRLSGVLVDVTAHREALERAAAGEARYRTLVEDAADGIGITSLDGVILSMNEAGAAILGGTPQEVIGRKTADLVERASRDDYLRARGEMLHGESDVAAAELTIRGLDGRRRQVEFRSRPLWRDGEIVGMHGSFRDVTEQRERELVAHRSQRLEALGRLASGVAHDFNNMLTAIVGYVSLAAAAPGRPDEELAEIARAAERAAALTRQLLAFGRQQPLLPERVDANEVVAAVERLLRRIIGEEVELALELAGEPVPVLVDEAQLEQALVNLVLNARDAITGRGRIELWTSCDGDTATIGVRDDGAGMDPVTRERAFEPFYTTKQRGEGTGLGLASVHGFVTQSGGDVLLESELGSGTSVVLRLPLAAAAEVAGPPAEAESPSPGRGERVLVVEDDEGVRELMVAILRRDGYAVSAADSARAALDLVLSGGLRPELLLVDVVLPRLGGIELARSLDAVVPDLAVLYVTGYADDLDPGELDEIGASLVAKPFAPEELARRVRAVLDAVRN